MRPLVVVAIPVILGSLSCSSLAPLSKDPMAPGGRMITQEMIASTNAKNAWDVVKSTGIFRMSDESSPTPPWIRSRRGRSSILVATADVPHIIVDGTRVHDVAYLYVIAANSIASIQILNGIEGSAREGLNSGAGVIYITTRVGLQQPKTFHSERGDVSSTPPPLSPCLIQQANGIQVRPAGVQHPAGTCSYALRSRQAVKFGLFVSSNGIGKFTSGP